MMMLMMTMTFLMMILMTSPPPMHTLRRPSLASASSWAAKMASATRVLSPEIPSSSQYRRRLCSGARARRQMLAIGTTLVIAVGDRLIAGASTAMSARLVLEVGVFTRDVTPGRSWTTRAAFVDGLLFTEQGTEQMQDFLWHAKGLPAPCGCICTRDESGFCDTDGGSLEEGGRAWLTRTPTSRRWRWTDRPAPGTKAGRRSHTSSRQHVLPILTACGSRSRAPN